MSSIKAALKDAKAALDAHKYDVAIKQAKTVLAADSKNYNANVFLGLAYEKQDQYEASETAYRAALKSKDKDSTRNKLERGWKVIMTRFFHSLIYTWRRMIETGVKQS